MRGRSSPGRAPTQPGPTSLLPCAAGLGAAGLQVAWGPPTFPFLHAFQGCWQSSTQHLGPWFKIYLLRASNCFLIFFLDPPTLTQQANKGPPTAPRHVVASAAPCQVPTAGTNAHLLLESRHQVKQKGWHCIQGVHLV